MNTPVARTAADLGPARYTWGGDEFLMVEVSEAMSLAANFRVMAIAAGLDADRPEGIVDLVPANASLLIRFDPDVLESTALLEQVKQVETAVREAQLGKLQTRVIEVPVWYEDPFTAEVEARFREGYHQDPSGTDLDYAAAVNGLSGRAELIARHHSQPWLVSMVGFVAGLPFMFQLTEQQKQLEVPKYLSPRTDTPGLCVGHGGCFSVIYSVRGGGGYQMFGVAAAPIYDSAAQNPDFTDTMVLFRPGDIVVFRPVNQDEYEHIQTQVDAGRFHYRMTDVEFDMAASLADPEGYNARIKEALQHA
ncbi:5-oxoprolinase subunit B family protein [Micrococcus luteus KDCGSN]|uniref:5-oxoprolinase subunit B family protein n=1 Tax=Micrococcus luteus TaxID=1270 RepID=UPI003EEFF599